MFTLTFQERMKVARERKGLTHTEAAAAATGWLPVGMSMSRGIVQRIEAGDITEEKANPVHLLALARVYEVEPNALSERTNEASEMLLNLCTHPVITGSGCTRAVAA